MSIRTRPAIIAISSVAPGALPEHRAGTGAQAPLEVRAHGGVPLSHPLEHVLVPALRTRVQFPPSALPSALGFIELLRLTELSEPLLSAEC